MRAMKDGFDTFFMGVVGKHFVLNFKHFCLLWFRGWHPNPLTCYFFGIFVAPLPTSTKSCRELDLAKEARLADLPRSTARCPFSPFFGWEIRLPYYSSSLPEFMNFELFGFGPF